jgi:hypothetical protein
LFRASSAPHDAPSLTAATACHAQRQGATPHVTAARTTRLATVIPAKAGTHASHGDSGASHARGNGRNEHGLRSRADAGVDGGLRRRDVW